MPNFIPPVPQGSDLDSVEFSMFLEYVRNQVNHPVMYAGTTDPGVGGVPNGTWAVWKNTTSGIVKVWANDGGVMKSVTLT